MANKDQNKLEDSQLEKREIKNFKINGITNIQRDRRYCTDEKRIWLKQNNIQKRKRRLGVGW